MTPTTEPLLENVDPLMGYDTPEDRSDVSENSAQVSENSQEYPETHNAPVVPVEVEIVKPQGRKFMLRLPKSVYDRFKARAVSERRQFHVVLEKAIEEFIEARECEPRPYIPPILKTEPLIDTQSKIDADLYMQLDVRADVEARTRAALGLRAVLNYLEKYENEEVVE